MPFAAALSQHPVPADAMGEVVGQVLERIGDEPDLAVLFVTPPHAGALEDAAGALAEVLRPGVLIGCAAVSVVGTAREVERTPGVSLWTGKFGPVQPVRLTAYRDGEGFAFDGWPADDRAPARRPAGSPRVR